MLSGASIVLASTTGFLAAVSLGAGKQTPTRTVTINVATGPQGPPGPPGTFSCPTGFSEGLLVINHPGGQTTIFTCIKD